MKKRKYLTDLNEGISFYSYLNSYQKSFEILFNSIENTNTSFNEISYSILFIARHSIEIWFKANIVYFKKYSKFNACEKLDTHVLKTLFGCFKSHINYTIINLENDFDINIDKSDLNEYRKYCEKIEKMIDAFEIIDFSSQNLRYPINTNKEVVYKEKLIVDLFKIKELFDSSIILLTYTSSLFSKYTDYKDTIDEIYRDELMANTY